MIEKRFNCHVKFSKLPNGFMVLDYTKKGKEQIVIEDISREKAHSVMNRLNELSDENHKIKSLLLKKVEELNDAYDKSAKAGMPTGGIIGELDSFEEVCRVMGWIE